jgi:anionic cell wall polymer biosynthesis LytR-Cps2A-Psr (LCP) family protein
MKQALIVSVVFLFGLIFGAVMGIKIYSGLIRNHDLESLANASVENTKQAIENLNHSQELNDKFRIKFEKCLKANEELNKRLWKR